MQKFELTRHQIEQIAIYMALNKNLESVTLKQSSESGIGPHHHAVFYNRTDSCEVSIDITDVGNW